MGSIDARKTWLCSVALVVVSGALVTGCSVLDLSETPLQPDPTVSASQVAKPTFSATAVDPVIVEDLYGSHHDPGLNVDWTLVGATMAPYGGVQVTLYIKNLNEVPLPPDAVSTAKLTFQDYAGNTIEAEPMNKDSSGVEVGLDLPLGAGAKTTIVYAFNTNLGNLYSAELQTGNVVFKGSLFG